MAAASICARCRRQKRAPMIMATKIMGTITAVELKLDDDDDPE
jgi:hypothetical protein